MDITIEEIVLKLSNLLGKIAYKLNRLEKSNYVAVGENDQQ